MWAQVSNMLTVNVFTLIELKSHIRSELIAEH